MGEKEQKKALKKNEFSKDITSLSVCIFPMSRIAFPFLFLAAYFLFHYMLCWVFSAWVPSPMLLREGSIVQ